MTKNITKISFFGASLGTMVEYYDYALFSIFLPILSPLFFPADSIYHSLVKGYVVLLITMIARPLGGIFFGYLGDVYGRRIALLASICGIAIATTAIGLTPTYAVIGASATVFIIVAKSIQLFCFGGEYNGAGIYVVELAQNKHEVLAGSLLTASTLFGSLIASFIGIAVTFHFMPTWGWRIAFLLGGMIGVLGIIYRKNFLESPNFEQAGDQYQSLASIIKSYPKELLVGIFIGGFATAPFTTVLLFINPVLVANGYFTNHQFMLMQTLFIFIAVVTLIAVGIVGDKLSPKKLMKFSCYALILLPYPLLCIVDKGNLISIFLALALLIVINEIFLGPSSAYLKNLYPMHCRYRGCSLGFCLGMSLIGGLTPIVDSYLYKATGHFSAVSVWLVFVGLGTLLSINLVATKQRASVLEAYI